MKSSKWLASLLLLCSISHNAYSDQKAKCHTFYAEAEINFLAPIPGPDPMAFGNIEYTIGGEILTAQVSIFIVSPVIRESENSVSVNINMLHDFGDGNTLTWAANPIFTETKTPGIFSMEEVVSLIDATGRFENTMGIGDATGTVSFDPSVPSTIAGVSTICTLKKNFN